MPSTAGVTRSSIAKCAASRDKPAKPYEVRADKPMGLLLRVQPSGKRTFYVQIARGKRQRLGSADVLTLKQAEERAKAVLRDPQAAAVAVKSGTTLRERITGTVPRRRAQISSARPSQKLATTSASP